MATHSSILAWRIPQIEEPDRLLASVIQKKKKEILPFVAKWMDLEGITLSEISQTEKHKYCTISLKSGIYKTQQTSEYNKKKPSQRYRELTSCYQ